MTLADYSLSDVAFDQVTKWKNTLQHLVNSCNQTEALGVMIPQLEEFIDVARSELFHMLPLKQSSILVTKALN